MKRGNQDLSEHVPFERFPVCITFKCTYHKPFRGRVPLSVGACLKIETRGLDPCLLYRIVLATVDVILNIINNETVTKLRSTTMLC